ncbi:MAG TPA: hypothetical protein VHY34_06440 [Caulobacteraceae bacterium]|jgi:hypothetical protein|nr:hypothetical protein [Caulobacteraceae bacterium]
MGLAFAAAAATVAEVAAHWGFGRDATVIALRLTARVGFLLFWPSYVGGALATLFGDGFAPLRRHGRELGLAFTAVLAVHLSVVAWLCWIGAAPSLRVFIIFGIAAIWVALLALASIGPIGRAAGAVGWWVLRNIGMNYIAFAFALDFLKRPPRHIGPAYLLGYIPFALLAVLGPALRLLAWLKRSGLFSPSARVARDEPA